MGVEKQRFTSKNTYILQGEERIQTRFARMNLPRFDGHEPLECNLQAGGIFIYHKTAIKSRFFWFLSILIGWLQHQWRHGNALFFFSWKELTKALLLRIGPINHERRDFILNILQKYEDSFYKMLS